MDNYTKSVKNASKNHINKRFANSSIIHAITLIDELIEHANKEVDILSPKFFTNFHKRLLLPIKKFLNRDNTNLKLITSENSNYIDELKQEYKDNFQYKILPLEQFPTDKQTDERVSFIVTDRDGFRYEYSIQDINIGVVRAIANFNSHEEAKYLKERFDELFNK